MRAVRSCPPTLCERARPRRRATIRSGEHRAPFHRAASDEPASPTRTYTPYFETALSRLKSERRYRTFAELERIAGRFPAALWHGPNGPSEVTVWCSNDYLGMGQHPSVVSAMVKAARRYGTGAGGTRNISGNSHAIVVLEAELADLHGKDAALAFSSGYASNQTGIATIAQLIPDCLILSDALNHNSIIEGVRASGREKAMFRHNDLQHLDELLKAAGNRPEAYRVRERLFHGWGHRSHPADLRIRGALWRDDLPRRSPCGRHVWSARRRPRRATGCHATH